MGGGREGCGRKAREGEREGERTRESEGDGGGRKRGVRGREARAGKPPPCAARLETILH
jgi:hypothetical protein